MDKEDVMYIGLARKFAQVFPYHLMWCGPLCGILPNCKKGMKYFHLQQHGWIEIIILSEVSQTNITRYCLYVESERDDTNGLIYKAEIDSQT